MSIVLVALATCTGHVENDASLRTEADALLEQYPAPFRDGVPYAAAQAKGLDAVLEHIELLPADLERLDRDGFVLVPPPRWNNSFARVYELLWRWHLPLYVTADSILYALHVSYSRLLASVEREAARPLLERFLRELRHRLAEGALDGADSAVIAAVDEHLAVASSLLSGASVDPVATGSRERVRSIVARCELAPGVEEETFLGARYTFDFSQLRPRGHYAGDTALERYFRAFMWLARAEARLVDVQPDGQLQLVRPAVDASLALGLLVDERARATWEHLDAIAQAFAGDVDAADLRALPQLTGALGVRAPADLAALDDAAIWRSLEDLAVGESRVRSQIVWRAPGIRRTWPLPRVLSIVGQRYSTDAHVMSLVSWDGDRLDDDGRPRRMMPSTLDVAFAALGNNGALLELHDELARYGYGPALQHARQLAETPDESVSMRSQWMEALRALSPRPKVAGGPAVTATRNWNRRILGTQLASWAALRRDNVLYQKESYTGASLCEFPTAYVDPYPEFYRALATLAEIGSGLVEELRLHGSAGTWADAGARYFAKLRGIAARLSDIAEAQLDGQTISAQDLAWINRMVRADGPTGCGPPTAFSGWYADLYFDRSDMARFESVVAAVHTQPTDEHGRVVGRVLHAGLGRPRTMVVTIDDHAGVQAYVGVVATYAEHVTTDFERLTDAEWFGLDPDPVAWLEAVLTP